MEGNYGLPSSADRRASEDGCSSCNNSNRSVERYSAIKKKVFFKKKKRKE